MTDERSEPKVVLLVRLLSAIDEGRFTFEELKEQIGTVLEPAGPSSNTAFAGGSHLVVSRESKSPELANARTRAWWKMSAIPRFGETARSSPG